MLCWEILAKNNFFKMLSRKHNFPRNVVIFRNMGKKRFPEVIAKKCPFPYGWYLRKYWQKWIFSKWSQINLLFLECWVSRKHNFSRNVIFRNTSINDFLKFSLKSALFLSVDIFKNLGNKRFFSKWSEKNVLFSKC